MLLNHRQGHTGQLAPATYAMQLSGNAARLFTTVHGLGADPVVLAQHGSTALLNAVVLLQMARYRRVTAVLSTGRAKVQKLPATRAVRGIPRRMPSERLGFCRCSIVGGSAGAWGLC